MKPMKSRRPGSSRTEPSRARSWAILAIVVLAGVVGALVARRASSGKESRSPTPAFSGTEAEAEGFAAAMSNRPSQPQRHIERKVLDGIRSPCCGEHLMSGRCCGCLLSRAITGLTRSLVLRGETDVEHLRRTVGAWIRAARIQGFSGRACVEQRCSRPFAADGCGGGMADGDH